MRILIANRGEIARRVIRTAHRLGHETVAVFAEPDQHAPHVAEATAAELIGPAALADSYLSIPALLDAARRSGADAVHPGYGFLSENTDFARAVADAGLTWIGPMPEIVESMGSKIEARRIASSAGVPIIPGFDQSQDPDDLAEAAGLIGYPVLVKAAAGGGGKGIRIVHAEREFTAALEEATTEAERSFGDGRMIVERFIQRPRHVEVQIIGDQHGNAVELGTRECSVQRRYQKLLEEAPAPNLPEATRTGLRSSAAELAASIGYDSAGTVEFVVDDETGDYFFLEMNTRLQVEHPVTEAITGLDLVELQLLVASGAPLPFTQNDVTLTGHAIEARINAEDAGRGFAPQIGVVDHLVVPAGIRWDAAIEPGSEITPHYDAMIAKLIAEGPDRAAALRSLTRALDTIVIGGVTTNAGFHRWLVDQPEIIDGRVTTRFIDERELPAPPEPAVLVAALACAAHARSAPSGGVWSSTPSFRLVPHERRRTVRLRDQSGAAHEVELGSSAASRWVDDGVEIEEDGGRRRVAASIHAASASGPASVAVNLDGHTHRFDMLDRTTFWAPASDGSGGSAGAVTAPFPAVVTEVAVVPGDQVQGGDVVVVIEAMKMLHSLRAAGPGEVAEVRVGVGDQTVSDQVLVTFVPSDEVGR